VRLDKFGRPQFRDLLSHRAEPCFLAFDLLMHDGKDLRSERLQIENRNLEAAVWASGVIQAAGRRPS